MNWRGCGRKRSRPNSRRRPDVAWRLEGRPFKLQAWRLSFGPGSEPGISQLRSYSTIQVTAMLAADGCCNSSLQTFTLRGYAEYFIHRVFVFHAPYSTRVYVPFLLPHTCVRSMHPPHTCSCSTPPPPPHVCSMSHPPQGFMFHASSSTSVYVEYAFLR